MRKVRSVDIGDMLEFKVLGYPRFLLAIAEVKNFSNKFEEQFVWVDESKNYIALVIYSGGNTGASVSPREVYHINSEMFKDMYTIRNIRFIKTQPKKKGRK